MDNLTISSIKQIETTENGFDIIITEIKTDEQVEFWYHVKGYGTARLAYGITAETYRNLYSERMPMNSIIDYINFDELEGEK